MIVTNPIQAAIAAGELPRAGARVSIVVAGSPRGHEGELAALRRACIADAFVGVCRARGVSVDVAGDDRDTDEDVHRWMQSAFMSLVKRDLAHWRDEDSGGGRWYLRASAYDEENDRRLSELIGWKPAAVATQAELLGRTDGVELNAATLDGSTTLRVFTPHADAIDDTAFVAVSPSCPAVEKLVRDLPLGEDGVVETGAMVIVPGVARPVPLVISAHVQERFGPTAVLGVPAVNAEDALIAERLTPLKTGSWRIASKPVDPRPAVRFRPREIALSDRDAVGPFVPVVRCRRCGPVPVDDSTRDSTCPGCGEAVGDGRQRVVFGSMGAWSAMRSGAPALSVRSAGSDLDILAERTIAKALRDAVDASEPTDGEPHGPTVIVGDVTAEQSASPKEHSGNAGDAMRFALLYAAAPSKPICWRDDVVRHCSRFLERLSSYAEPRLAFAATSDDHKSAREVIREHRPLAKWSRIAAERVTENLAAVETHRATRNVMMLFERIENFECRLAVKRGDGLEDADRAAIASALLTLAQLLSPLAPDTAQGLWERGGMPGLVAERWPLPE
jgi:leucyl-tRNA synthetase